tara:strand:- start:61 stop:912 length:852 start_codon:yes stop_codon:yes gene_type:complete
MDIEKIINEKQISESSKKVYLSLLKRMTKAKFKIPTKANEKLTYVKQHVSSFDNPNTRLDMLNLIIVIRNELELSIEKLKEYRTELKQQQKAHQVTKMADAGDKLMTYDDFVKALQEAYNKQEWKKYIVNYLIMTYGVRNKDLNLEIVKTKKEMKEGNNYLLLKKDKVVFIRDDYKTKSTYGKKTHEIHDKLFYEAVKKTGLGKLIAEQQISNGLRKLYINKMGEAKIFKMMIDKYYEDDDSASIKRLAADRGTSLSVVQGFYNVNAEDNPISKAMNMSSDSE